MTNYGYSHSFNRCRGTHLTLNGPGLCCTRRVQWYSNDPRIVAENKFGTRSIWIRHGADRYKPRKRIHKRTHISGGKDT
jgi:hypothetical protein